MYIRHIRPEDDRMSISEIYERSWKHAYKDILPDSYLNAIPRGHWASVIDSPGWNTLILFDRGKWLEPAAFANLVFRNLKVAERSFLCICSQNIWEKDMEKNY